jgi:hypothetical protein
LTWQRIAASTKFDQRAFLLSNVIIVLKGLIRWSWVQSNYFLTFIGQAISELMCDKAVAIEIAGEVVLTLDDPPENALIQSVSGSNKHSFLYR